MRIAVTTAAAAAALVLAAPSQGAVPWSKMTLKERKAHLLKVIHRDRSAIRWWLMHRPNGQFVRALESAGSVTLPLQPCKPLGVLAPARVCAHARHLPQAIRTLRMLERRLAMTFPTTNDWVTAVRVAQRAYPGTEWWLLSCSASEGGHGRWVYFASLPYAKYGAWNTPGGPLQYKQGTFWHDFNRARADVQSRGFRVPASTSSWFSMLGQALAGGWAYSHARPSGKWTGGGC